MNHFNCRFTSGKPKIIFICILTVSKNKVSHNTIHFNWRYPFDWKHPFGYLIVFLSQYLMCFYIYCAVVIGVSFVVESYWFFILLNKDLANDFVTMNRAAGKRWIFFMEFCKLIQQHSNAKEFSWILNSFFHNNNNNINIIAV